MMLPILFFLLSKYIFPKVKNLAILSPFLLFFVSLSFLMPRQSQKIVEYISAKQFDFNNLGKGGFYFKNENDKNSYSISYEDYSKFSTDMYYIIFKEDVTIDYSNGKDQLHKKLIKKNTIYKPTVSLDIKPSNSYIKTTLILSSTKQLIKNIPAALLNVLFRPFPTDTRTKFNYLQFTETFILFSLLSLAIIKRRKLNRDEKAICISLLMLVLILSTLIGLTTPIVGAIVRYRIPAYLAITIISFILIKPFDQWKSKKYIS